MGLLYFDEPLFLQRQSWILNKIRQVKHENLIELGCADGPITRALSRPSLWLDASEEWKTEFKDVTSLNSHPFLEAPSISPKTIVAIDIDQEQINGLKNFLELQRQEELDREELRFSRLNVEFILQNYKEILESPIKPTADVLVASEFIEHLNEQDLNSFGHIVLGLWKPKVILLTTPNHSFNVKFNKNQINSTGFKDPTGRTERIFRHSDHKFEWTMNEFQQWTNTLAERYNYKVEFDLIGKGYRTTDNRKQEDLTDGEEARYASQCAILILQDDIRESQINLEPPIDAHTTILFQSHQENFENQYEPQEDYSKEEIKDVFNTVFESIANNTENGLIADIYSIWLDEELRQICQGKIENLFPNPGSNIFDQYSLFVRNQDVFVRRNENV